MWQKIPKPFLVDCVETHPLFSPFECQQLIDLPGVFTPSMVADEQGADIHVPDLRQGSVKPVLSTPENHWFLERLWQTFEKVNAEIFQFSIDGIISGIQIIHYPPGGLYDWHMDIGSQEYSFRKLSMVIFLSDPATYEGGRLQIYRQGFKQAQGTAVIFPSYMLHKVDPVTQGERYVLACWAEGFCFR